MRLLLSLLASTLVLGCKTAVERVPCGTVVLGSNETGTTVNAFAGDRCFEKPPRYVLTASAPVELKCTDGTLSAHGTDKDGARVEVVFKLLPPATCNHFTGAQGPLRITKGDRVVATDNGILQVLD
jgi:hypothetical protein